MEEICKRCKKHLFDWARRVRDACRFISTNKMRRRRVRRFNCATKCCNRYYCKNSLIKIFCMYVLPMILQRINVCAPVGQACYFVFYRGGSNFFLSKKKQSKVSRRHLTSSHVSSPLSPPLPLSSMFKLLTPFGRHLFKPPAGA